MAADPDDMDLIQTLYYTAGRISEILNLKWEDINFEHNWIQLWTRKRRGGELQKDKLLDFLTPHAGLLATEVFLACHMYSQCPNGTGVPNGTRVAGSRILRQNRCRWKSPPLRYRFRGDRRNI